jgi:hypothetical protein
MSRESDMSDPKGKTIKRTNLKFIEGSSSFAALLCQEGDAIRRDMRMNLDLEESASGRL